MPDDKVKTFPYESVGKLFYTKVGPSGSRDVYATAWVANMSTILNVVYTATHVLKKADMHAENILFIPGFIPPNIYLLENTRKFKEVKELPGMLMQTGTPITQNQGMIKAWSNLTKIRLQESM